VICTVLKTGKPVLAIFFLPDSFFCYRSNWYSCPFGAFMMGSIMPIFLNLNDIYRKVEDVAVILLLPCFFVFTGLKTEIAYQ
jgi:tellurite resistance protein TehA-like permease